MDDNFSLIWYQRYDCIKFLHIRNFVMWWWWCGGRVFTDTICWHLITTWIHEHFVLFSLGDLMEIILLKSSNFRTELALLFFVQVQQDEIIVSWLYNADICVAATFPSLIPHYVLKPNCFRYFIYGSLFAGHGQVIYSQGSGVTTKVLLSGQSLWVGW